MRAVRFEQYGPDDVLEVVDVDTPVPRAGEVVVAVRAAGINPGEIGIREGRMHERWPATFPEGEGSDFAGVVDAAGPGVAAFRPGDDVVGFTNDRASHAEFVRVSVDQVVAKPANVPWDAAGALFVAGTTAYAVVAAAQVGPGDVVVVSAAAGGVGSLTVQWARRAGASVIGLASPAHHDWLWAHGVEPVEYAGEDFVDRVRAAADDRAVTALLDTHGGGYVQLGLDLGVAPERIATIADFGAGRLGARVVSHSVAATAPVMAELVAAIAAGELEVPIAARFPLEQVRDAYRLQASGHVHGKIVLVP
ncbi:NADP-dependent oxidoreductase [Microbacterium sp.]|uniref:NADP-dependent oxidoreductase n=1 Tax=Microbacterium sp. TaxID=51671 RepID=UPI003A8FCB84